MALTIGAASFLASTGQKDTAQSVLKRPNNLYQAILNLLIFQTAELFPFPAIPGA